MQSTLTRAMAIAAGLAALILVVVTPSGPSSADTTTPYATKASVGAQVDVAPGTPLTGLSDGDVVTVRVEEGGGQTLSGIQVRLCRDLPPAGISGTTAFSSDGAGNCVGVDDPPVPPAPHDTVKVRQKTPGDTFVQTTFTLSTGSWSWTTAQGNVRSMTCDASNPCDLWVRHQGSLPGGNAFVHYDLEFAAAPSTTTSTSTSTSTTVAPSTTTTVGPTTSTTVEPTTTTTVEPTTTTSTTVAPTTSSTSTSTTVAPSTSTTSSTSTTVAPSTTTTVAPSTSTTVAPSTTTTVAPTTSTTVEPTTSTTVEPTTTTTEPTTTTTLPDGTTVTPSTPAGGTIDVESTGWAPSSEVVATLNSDPVDLGTRTTDDTGKLVATYAVPASVPAGDHTLVLTGTDAAGAAREVSAGVTVTAEEPTTTTTADPAATSTTSPSGGEIPRTGAQSVRELAAAVLFVCAGGLLVTGSRQRMLRLRSPR